MEEFNIMEFFRFYFNKIYIVIIAVIIGVCGSYFYTYHYQVPMFRSETSILLVNSNNNTITQNDVSLNKSLISTYRQIAKSRLVLNQVIDNLHLKKSYGVLAGQVGVSSVGDTDMILISVSDVDKTQAKKIADEVAVVFRDEITDKYHIENVSIIDKALVSDVPYNVNVVKQFVMGEALGFFLSSFIIVVLFYMDDSVKSEEDIEKILGLSVLGSVPKYRGKRG